VALKAKIRVFSPLVIAFVSVVFVCSVFAAVTGNWSINGNQSANTTVNGVNITWTGTPGPAEYRAGTFILDEYWTDPWNGSFGGGNSLEARFRPYGTNRTITVTFSKPVDDPVLHVDRLGEISANNASSSVFTLSSFAAESSDVTVSRLSGNPQFQVNTGAKSFRRATGSTSNSSNNCTQDANRGTACGSIQFVGSGITRLTFDVSWSGADSGNRGDSLEVRWSIGSTVVVKKQSVGSTGIYSFTGTNGVGSFRLNTAATNPATSARLPIPDNSQDIAITEAASAVSSLTSVVCLDPAGNTVPTSLSGLTARLTPANYASVNRVITCTFTNTAFQPGLRITKSNNAPWTAGQTGALYSLTVSNIGGQATSGTITARDTLPAGITPSWIGTRAVSSNGVNWSCVFSGQAITCTTGNPINYTGTNSSVITLPVNISAAANIGSPLINYASVGGGGDPFNSGNAPQPGSGCTDTNHCASNSVTITNQPPQTISVTAPTMLNTAPSTSIPALAGSDPDGTVVGFQILGLPPAAAGTLYLCNGGCSPVTAGQIISAADADDLQFDPAAGYTGTAQFNYSAVDNLGAAGASAGYRIPIGYVFDCSKVYASAFSSGRRSIYELNGATMTPVITVAQNVGGIAVSPNGSAYYDNAAVANPPLYRHDGVSQTNTGASVPGLLAGQAADIGGNVYYIDSSRHLRRVNAGSGGAATDLGAITFAPGDTIGPTLQYGDMTFDGNGRLYWYSSVNGTGASYLFIVNLTTLLAKNTGQLGPNGATGVAFDGAGRLITTGNSGQTVVAIDITSPNLTATTLGIASPSVYDMASCALPFFNPNLVANKTVANITQGQNPATIANINDILEYTVVVTNTGNLGTSGATLSDGIPAGTTYVANSTTLNGVPVADASGAMPYASPAPINTNGQPPGVVNPGGSTATVSFRVRVNGTGLPPEIRNIATTRFVTTNGGFDTNQTVDSNETVTPTFLQPPDVGLVKSCPAPADCETAPQLAGTNLSFSIQFSNTGGQAANGLTIVDANPPDTDFQLNSATANPGTTVLSFVIEYSSDYDPNNPTAATWTYTPVTGGGGAPPGYDRLVKAIRWRVISGSLPHTVPNNSGNVGFTVQIR